MIKSVSKYWFLLMLFVGMFNSEALLSQQTKKSDANTHTGFFAADTTFLNQNKRITFKPQILKKELKPTSTSQFSGIRPKRLDSTSLLKFSKKTRKLQFDTIYQKANWQDDTSLHRTVRFPPMKNAAPFRYKDQAICDVKYLDVDQGLSSSYIHSLLPDSRGLLWFGTYEGGLVRYNGHAFTVFKKEHGLPGNSVRALYEDNEGNIWLGTQGNGMAIFDGHRITTLPETANLNELYIYHITEDAEGRIWVSTRNSGLFVLTKDAILQLNKQHGLPDNEVYTTHTKNTDSIWVGTPKGPLLITDNTLTHYFFEDRKTTNQIKYFLKDKFGNLCLGSHHNLVIFDKDEFREIHIQLKIKKLQKDLSGNLWIASIGYGLFKLQSEDKNYNTARYTKYTETHGLSHNYISDIAIKKGLLWMGTYGGGVNILNINGFGHITNEQGLKSENVWAFTEDSKHNLWLGTETAGICLFQDSAFTYYDRDSAAMKSHIVLSATKDQKNNLWFGTYKGGVYKIEGNKLFEVNLNPQKKRLKIISMLADSKGNIWFGSWDDGVFRYNGDSVWQINAENGLKNNDVFDIMEDQKGNIWFATDGGGVTQYDGQQFLHYNTTSGLISNNLYSAVEMNDGTIWFGTQNDGIVVLNDTSRFTITMEDGLSSNNIKSIIEDSQRRIWIGTEQGLNLIKSINRKAPSSANDLNIQRFDKNHGLKGLDFHTNSVYIDQNNTAWWGTGKALTYLNLDESFIDTLAPEVKIEAIQVKQRWVDFHNIEKSTTLDESLTAISTDKAIPFYNKPNNLKVSYKSRHITFHYSALHYQNIENTRYITRLYPLEQKWSLPSTEPKTDYRNIPPGNYKFQIKALTPQGLTSEITSQNISISTPWWMTIWAYLAYAIILIAFIMLLLRWRTRLLKKRQKELESQVKERTIEVQEKNEELNVLVKKVTEQRNEIATQRDMVVTQRDQLEQVNKSTSQSIDYAQRIQSSLMPDIEGFKSIFPESFLLFRPRDIVSGDFYWWAKIADQTVIVAADCTGHGVPGAFMSILGMSFLREIVLKEKTTQPDKILHALRDEIIQALQQKNKPGEQRDGLDMTVITLKKGSNKALFAGAHNSVYHVQNNHINEVQGDRFTIAAYPELKPFHTREITFKPGDSFYMFTDGYHDQFGGQRMRKIKKPRFQELILKMQGQNMKNQKQELIRFLENWQGKEEQIDDILVMGFQIPEKGI